MKQHRPEAAAGERYTDARLGFFLAPLKVRSQLRDLRRRIQKGFICHGGSPK
jgi:hypothetical protein